METIVNLQEDRSMKMANESLSRTAEWINLFGGRLAGSNGCKKTAEKLGREFKEICGNAKIEKFFARPSAFGNFLQIYAVLYLLGVLLLLVGQPRLAALVLTFNFVASSLQFGFYLAIYDWLYPRAECQNVSAVLEPRGEVTRQLIFSAHHDAAREFKFLRGNQKWYGLKILIPDVFCMLGCLVAWIQWSSQIFSFQLPGFIGLSNFVLSIGVFFVFTKFSLFTDNVSPGAGDNLIAATMLVELAKHFHDPAQSGRSTLQHTRVIFASFDAEEAGLRGSRAWVREHQQELQNVPTFALNIDNIYNLKDLRFLVSDLNDHILLDRDLVNRCLRIAKDLGYPSKTTNMPFGGGGTDAAELTRAGVRATTMLAMPTSLVRDDMVYHTLRDTVDKIEIEAVSACLKVAEKLAFEIDAEIL